VASDQKPEPTEVMVVNDSPGEECRIAILEDNHLEELYTERTVSATNVGNIYKGRVINVESAIQAAFIDYGKGVNGFLHISDLHPRYFPGAGRTERVGKKIPRRERPLIQEALRRGDEVLIQVLKEGIGTKGPTLTSYLSIPGRLLVVMPDMDRVGVSRKVEDEEKRREMRKILDSLDLPDGFGFILRTAGFGQAKTELKRDVAYLMRLWKVMEKRIKKVAAPCELYTESDLLIRTLRDVLRPSIQVIIVDSESAYQRVSSFLRVVAPRSAPRVIQYHRATPIFHTFDIERQIELIHSREVPLTSGGQLIIEQTEALVAIDVNSGRSRSARDSETNAYQTNCEAVDEICRQLRLRDLGGLIINDLIDMHQPRHRRLIEERFRNKLKRDRARSTILRISQFGLLEMTRQRMRPSLHKSHFVTCPTCRGHGDIKAPDSVAADVTRQVGYLLDHKRVKRLEIVCSPRVASVLLSRKRWELVRLEESSGKLIDVRVSDDIAVDRVDYYAYDERNADVASASLPPPQPPTPAELEAEDAAAQARQAEPLEPEKAEPHQRSRRRRRGGPADATAIALAGDFRETDEEEAADRALPGVSEKKRSRRRRRRSKAAAALTTEAAAAVKPSEGSRPSQRRTKRRRKKAATAPALAAAQAVEAEVKSAAAGGTIRIHELARELNVASREVVEQCQAEGGIPVKSHMSSVPPDTAEVIRSWFEDAPAPASTAEAASDRPGTETPDRPASRRRRRRGGRRRSGKAHTEQTEAKPEAAAAPTRTKKKSRRSRRSKSAAESARSAAAESPPPEDAARPSQPPTKKRRKKKKSGKQSSESPSPEAAESPADSEPRLATTKKKKKRRSSKRAGKAASAPESSTAAPAVESGTPATPRKKRRTLYRSRRQVSASAREVAVEAEADVGDGS